MSNGKAIGIVETSSIAKGFEIADSVLKAANVNLIVNRTICPGKYMVIIGGEVDAVNAGIEAGLTTAAHTTVDHFVIANLHPSVFPAISGVSHLPELKALGVIEAFSVASVIEAADAAVKATSVELITLNLAMAIGGKGMGVDDRGHCVSPGGRERRGGSHRAQGLAGRESRHRRASPGDCRRVHLEPIPPLAPAP